MPKVKRVCRVCGKEYSACCTPNWGVFRWQDVACSYECGQAYLIRVTAMRDASRVKTAEETDE